MTVEMITKILEEVSNGTDFNFTDTEFVDGALTMYMNGDNPYGEDWNEFIEIEIPTDKDDLIKKLSMEMYELYENFDVENNVYMMLEAKHNGFAGVPGVVDLVHNEEYKEKALGEFADKLADMLKEEE